MLNTYRETIDRFFGLYNAGSAARGNPPGEPADEKEPQK
jgi:hypothetical protein